MLILPVAIVPPNSKWAILTGRPKTEISALIIGAYSNFVLGVFTRYCVLAGKEPTPFDILSAFPLTLGNPCFARQIDRRDASAEHLAGKSEPGYHTQIQWRNVA